MLSFIRIGTVHVFICDDAALDEAKNTSSLEGKSGSMREERRWIVSYCKNKQE